MYSILCNSNDKDDDRLISVSYEDSTDVDVIFPKIKPYARYSLLLLTSLNLFNYCDRFIPSTTKEMMKNDWNLSDAETGYAVLAFLLSYMIFGPLFGTLTDCGIPRKLLLGFGIIGWSVASASAFWTENLTTFLVSRACVGIGESSFAVIAPSFISDFYPETKRNTALTVFYVSMPVGSAVGFGLGGILASSLGWKYAYLITGIPGIILALLLIPIKDPGIGSFENQSGRKGHTKKSWIDTFRQFWKIKLYIIVVIGSILQAFGIGAIADWLPAYYARSFPQIPTDVSFLIVGGVTVVGGFCGIILGGSLADLFEIKGVSQPYILVATLGSYLAATCCCISLYYKNVYSTTCFVALAEVFYFSTTAPLSALIANLMDSPYRARAYGFQLLISHALGDAISPTLVGLISDKYNLDLAITLVPCTLALSGVVYLLGWLVFFKSAPPPSQHSEDKETNE